MTYQTDLTSDLKLSLNGGMNTLKRVRNTVVGELTGGLELPGLFTLSNVKSGTTPTIDSDSLIKELIVKLGFGQLS